MWVRSLPLLLLAFVSPPEYVGCSCRAEASNIAPPIESPSDSSLEMIAIKARLVKLEEELLRVSRALRELQSSSDTPSPRGMKGRNNNINNDDVAELLSLFRYNTRTNTVEITRGANLWLHSSSSSSHSASQARRGQRDSSYLAGGNLIIGSSHDYTDALESVIIGKRNEVKGGSHFVSGFGNIVTGSNSFAVSTSSVVRGIGAVCLGGAAHTVTADFAVGVGGNANTASGPFSIVLGGSDSKASGDFSGVLIGDKHETTGYKALAAGGQLGIASGNFSVVLGGYSSRASGYGGWVGGGEWSHAEGWWSSAGMGYQNRAQGYLSMALGGEHVSVTERNGYRVGGRGKIGGDSNDYGGGSNHKSGSNTDQRNSPDKPSELPSEYSPRELRFFKALEEEGVMSSQYQSALHFLNQDPGFATSDATILNETYAVITKVYEERLLQLGFGPGIVFFRCMELKSPHGQLRGDATRVIEIPRSSDIRALRTPFKCMMLVPQNPSHAAPIHSRLPRQQGRNGEQHNEGNLAGCRPKARNSSSSSSSSCSSSSRSNPKCSSAERK